MGTSPDPAAPPSRMLLNLELRAAFEFQAFVTAYSFLRQAPRGDGHPVMVLPGLSASDHSTAPLRTYLREQGYAVHGWKQGQNKGPRPGVEQALDDRLAELHDRYGAAVSLIGISLGGIFAREMARRAPQKVRQVITLGSPIANPPRASNVWPLYERLSAREIGTWHQGRDITEPPKVPCTAIFTRTDGIVAWQGCRERKDNWTDNIEVDGSHSGLGHNPLAVFAIADRLALPKDEWAPFDRGGVRRSLYPDPNRPDDRRTNPFAA